jgi:hypothetical protein
LGTIAPKHREKRGSRADQRAGRINNIDVRALSAKSPSPVQIRAAPPVITSFFAQILAWFEILLELLR